MTTKIAITWKAFGDIPDSNRKISTVEFEADFAITEENVDTFLEVVYAQTNTYRGNLWNIIEPLLSPTRTHTALSVGDEIAIDDKTYKVADCGFTLIDKAVA
jgi:hypothetical protein